MFKNIFAHCTRILIPLFLFALLLASPSSALASTCTTTNHADFDITVCLDAPASNPATLTGDTVVTGSYNSVTLRNSTTVSRLEFSYTPSGGAPKSLASMFNVGTGNAASFTWDTDHYLDTTNGTLQVVAVMSKAGVHTDSDPAQQTITLNNGITTPPTNTSTFTPTTYDAAVGGHDMVAAVVGDGSSNETSPPMVAALMDSWNPDISLHLGDVYYKGTHEEFQNFYEDTFGIIKNVTNPVVGNHEYLTDTSATGYMWYWDNIPNYYSYDAGGWHFIALNTNYTKITTTTSSTGSFSNGGPGGVGQITDATKNWRTNQWVNQTVTAGGETHYITGNTATVLTLREAWTTVPSSVSYTINGGKLMQQAWLEDDLAANAGKCTIAYSHHPRWSIGSHGSDVGQDEIWNTLVDNKATTYLVGHDHSYQRWTAMGLSPSADATPSGVNSFVVGTGGHGSTSISGSDSRVLSSIGGTPSYGALKMVFTKSKYDFEYYRIATGTVYDSGTIQCQGEGSMSGFTVDNTSTPLSGVNVAWTGTAADGTPVSGSDTTDSNGEWDAPNLPSAVYSVTFTKSDRITENRTVEVGGASDSDVGEVTMSTNASITGMVVNQNADPVPGATISTQFGNVTSDGSGYYTLSNLGNDNIALTVSATGHIPQMVSVTTTAGSPVTQNFNLAQVVFEDDFESGGLTGWTTNNNFTVQSTDKHTGTYAAEGNTTSAATNLRKTLGSTYSHLHMRTYFNVKSQASGSGLGLLAYRTSTDGAIMKTYIDGTTGKLCIRNEVTLTNTCSTTVPTQNAWHSVELETAIAGTNSTHKVWYDGTEVTSLTSSATDLGSTNIGRVVLGEVNSGRTFDVVFDNVVVTNGRADLLRGKIMGTAIDDGTSADLEDINVSYSGGSTTTDEVGSFYFVNVPFGTYTVTAGLTGYYQNATHDFTVASLAGDTYEYELVTSRGHVSGTVKDIGNNNLTGATVQISGGAPQNGTSVTTDGSGNYTFSYTEPGTYTVTASKSGYTTKTAQVTITANATATQNFNLPLIVFSDDFESNNLASKWSPVNGFVSQSSTVHFGTYAAEGNATGGSAMNLRKNLGATYPELYFRTHFNLKSQASGSNVSLLWFRTGSDTGIFKTYIDGNNGRLCLRNEITLTNTCATGVTPSQNAWHTLEMQGIVNGTGASTHKIWLDGVEITALSSTTADLGSSNIGRVYMGETTSGRTYDIVFDDVMIQDVKIGSAGGTITGTITDAQSSGALGGATVSIPGKSTTADGSGVYTLSDVAPGTYTVTGSKTNYTDNTGSAVVVADSSTTTNIALTGANIGSITGTVTDAGTSSPVSGVTVSYSGGNATTDGSGVYTISGVAAGTYSVTASKSGYTSKTESSVVVTAGNATTQNFALPLLLHSDNFESNDFTAWTTNNNMTMQSSVVNGGTYAPEGNATGTSAMNLRKTLSTGVSSAYFRTYFYVNSQATGSGLGLVAYRSTSDGAIMKVYIDGNNGKLCIRNEVTLTNTCSNTVPTQDAWHAVELYANINGTSSSHKVWYDGTEDTTFTTTTADLGTVNIGRLVLGEVNTGRTYDVFFDDVIAQNVYVGL
jgi:hypothetical protein